MLINRNTALYITVYFVQAIFSIAGIAKMLFLKDTIGLSIPEIATLESIIIIPWTIKPLYGVISDMLPIMRRKRIPYIFMASSVASIGWILMGTVATTYNEVLIALLLGAIGLAFTDVATDGLIVESSDTKTIGKIQSLCWGSFAVASVIGSLISGNILSIFSHKQIFFLAAAFPLVTVLLSLQSKESPKEKSIETSSLHFLKSAMRALFEKRIFIAALFVFLWNAAPAVGTPLFFRLRDTLGFSETTLGYLGAANGIGLIAGAILYGKFLDKFPLKKVLTWTVLINGTSALLIFAIATPLSALILYFLFGITFYIAWLPILKFTAETCPKGIEATMFALLASILNLGKVASEYLGGRLFQLVGFFWLVIISALVTLAILPLIPLLKVKPENS